MEYSPKSIKAATVCQRFRKKVYPIHIKKYELVAKNKQGVSMHKKIKGRPAIDKKIKSIAKKTCLKKNDAKLLSINPDYIVSSIRLDDPSQINYLWVAESENGQPTGFMLFYFKKDHYYISTLCAGRSVGSGAGSFLLKRLMATANRQHVKMNLNSVLNKNTLRLYNSSNFVRRHFVGENVKKFPNLKVNNNKKIQEIFEMVPVPNILLYMNRKPKSPGKSDYRPSRSWLTEYKYTPQKLKRKKSNNISSPKIKRTKINSF